MASNRPRPGSPGKAAGAGLTIEPTELALDLWALKTLPTMLNILVSSL